MALTKISTGGVKDDTADEAKLKVSNAGSNGQFLQKQSGSTGGLTWADVTIPDADKCIEGNTSVEAVDTGSDGHVKITTEGTERARVDNLGNLSVGGTSPSTQSAKLQAYGTSQNGTRINMHHEGNSSASISANGGLVLSADGANGTTERFRVGTSGQLGVGGATYGTSGQVLTSGGASAAPSWAAIPPAGNTVDLVADGAIAAGKPVIISSAGKAKQVGNELVQRSGNPTYAGTVLNHNLNDGRSNVIQTINCGTNLILSVYYKTSGNAWNYNVTYIDSGQQNVAKASTNGNTDSALGGASTNASIALAYLGNNKVCIFYNGETAGQVHALIAEINPSTRAVTFGSAVLLGGGNCRNCAVSYDTDNSRLLFCWNNGSTNGRGYYRSASFSGTTITTLGSGASEFPRISSNYGVEQIRNVYDTSADRHVVTFNYQDNSNDGCAFSVETTGSTFTAGSLFTFTTGTVNNSMGFESCFDSVNNRTIITWAESTSGARFKIRGLICNASTGAITAAGSANNGGGDWYPYYSEASMVFNTGVGTAYLLAQFREGSSGNYWIVMYVLSYNSSAGTYSSTAGWAIYASTNQRRYLGLAAFNNTNNELQIVSNRTYESSSSNRYHDVMRVITMSSQTNFSSDQRNFLGFAEDAISDGNTGTIKLAGNIVGNQSGLTPGLLYKTNNDGTLTQAWGNGEVGLLAVASDKGQVIRSLV